jgi:hypothetical protein
MKMDIKKLISRAYKNSPKDYEEVSSIKISHSRNSRTNLKRIGEFLTLPVSAYISSKSFGDYNPGVILGSSVFGTLGVAQVTKAVLESIDESKKLGEWEEYKAAIGTGNFLLGAFANHFQDVALYKIKIQPTVEQIKALERAGGPPVPYGLFIPSYVPSNDLIMYTLAEFAIGVIIGVGSYLLSKK